MKTLVGNPDPDRPSRARAWNPMTQAISWNAATAATDVVTIGSSTTTVTFVVWDLPDASDDGEEP